MAIHLVQKEQPQEQRQVQLLFQQPVQHLVQLQPQQHVRTLIFNLSSCKSAFLVPELCEKFDYSDGNAISVTVTSETPTGQIIDDGIDALEGSGTEKFISGTNIILKIEFSVQIEKIEHIQFKTNNIKKLQFVTEGGNSNPVSAVISLNLFSCDKF